MASIKLIYLLLLVPTLSLTIIAAESAVIKGAYYPDWAIDAYPPSLINTSLFTHVLYAFVSPNNITFKFEISDSTAQVLQNFTATLGSKSPSVKTLVSIGGGSSDPESYATMASQAESRQTFINSSIDMARKYGFDGLDLDWESPANPQQMEDLGLLFDEWRSAIETEASSSGRDPLLLTAAVYFAVDFFVSDTYRKYPVTSINQNLDWINAMCYDYHGSWDTSETGAHAALYDPNSNVSTSYGLQSWADAGLSKSKIVMGLPLYGRTWTLKDANNNGIGAPAVGVGPGDDGTMPFSEVEDFNNENNATVVYDEATVSTYSYAGLSWIGYDDTKSTTKKVEFARDLGIGGYFFWAVSQDQTSEIPAQASNAW